MRCDEILYVAQYAWFRQLLHRENRKIGSFSPLCTLSASLSSIEAFKILCELDEFLLNTSKRIEFGLRSMDFNIINIPKDDNCTICAKD